MSIPRNSKVYIDGMILVYYFVTPNHYFNYMCRGLLKDIEKGHLIGLVSTFALLEAIGVAKRIISDDEKREITVEQVQTLEKTMDQHLNNIGTRILDADGLASTMTSQPIFKRAHDIMTSSGMTFCRDRNSDGWESVGGADSIHIALAEQAGADYIATFDRGFKKMGSKTRYLSMKEEYR